MWLNLHKYCFGLLLFLTTGLLHAQSSEIDELKEFINAEEYQKSIAYADELLQTELEPEDKFRILNLRSDAYYELGDIENCLKGYLIALESVDVSSITTKDLQTTHSYTGFCFNELNLQEEAIKYYNLSLEKAIELNDSIEIAISHFNLSNSQLKLGRLNEAMENLQVAYQLDLARKDTSAINFDLNSMGYAQYISGNYKGAIAYYKKSIELLKVSKGNYNSFGSRYNNLGKAYLALKNFDSARYYFQESIKQHELRNDSINLAERWVNMASLYIEEGNYSAAINWANKAKNYFDQVEHNKQSTAINFVLINAYKGQQDYLQALNIANQTVQLSKELNSLADMVSAIELRAEIYEAMNQLPKALDDYKTLKVLRDSLLNKNNRTKISELEVKYRVDDITQQNKILELERTVMEEQSERKSEQLKWLFFLLLISIVAAITIAYALITRHKLKQKLLTSELNELRSQIKVALEGDTSSLDIDKFNQHLENPLTEREAEILNLALSDLSNGEIAEKTFVSVNTVKFHLKKVYDKIGVTSRKEALQFALKSGK